MNETKLNTAIVVFALAIADHNKEEELYDFMDILLALFHSRYNVIPN